MNVKDVMPLGPNVLQTKPAMQVYFDADGNIVDTTSYPYRAFLKNVFVTITDTIVNKGNVQKVCIYSSSMKMINQHLSMAGLTGRRYPYQSDMNWVDLPCVRSGYSIDGQVLGHATMLPGEDYTRIDYSTVMQIGVVIVTSSKRTRAATVLIR